MEDQDKFVKGFRDGYLLGKYEPELLKKMLTMSGSIDYSEGLKEGAKQFEKENFQAKFKSPNNSKEKGLDNEV